MSRTWYVATVRAVAQAVVVGGLGFLAVWSQTDDVKILVTAGLTPFLALLGTRLGVEGYIDSRGGTGGE